MYQQQLPLAADPNQITQPWYQIDPNRPPHVPAIQPPIPQLNGFIPWIAGRMAQEIQAQAQQNPLRIYMYNLCAANQFSNQFFDQIVVTAVDFTAWLTATQGRTVQQAIEEAVSETAAMCAAANTRDYAGLIDYVQDPHVRNEVLRTIEAFDSVGAMIGQWKQQQRSYRAPAQTGVYAGPGRPTPQATSNYAAATSSGQFTPAVRPGQAPAVAAPVASAFAGTASSQSRWSAPATVVPATQGQAAEELDDLVNPNGATIIDGDIHNFVPSKQVPYFLAYNPSEMVATLIVEADGTTRPDYQGIDQTDMDYDKHATPMAFGKVPSFLDISDAAKTMNRISVGLKELNKESRAPLMDEDEKPVLKKTIAADWVCETSETAAWVMASGMRMAIDSEDGPPDVYRVYAMVAEPVLTLENESNFVQQLAKCKTFVGLREKLVEGLGGEMSLELFNVINMRMTDLVNRKIRLELGISRPQTNNFNDDIGALIDLLEKKGGLMMKNAFLKNQQRDIALTLNTITEHMAADRTNLLLAGIKFPEGKQPAVTYVSTNYSLTFLECMSWEINVELGVDGIPTRVTKELTPLFYDLVKGAFDDAKNFEDDTIKSLEIGRFLLRTADGRIMEATRGALVEDSYLVTIIK